MSARRNAKGRCVPTRPGGSRRTLGILGVVVTSLFLFPYWYVNSRNKGNPTPVQFSKINSNKRPIRSSDPSEGATTSRVKS